MLSKEKLPHFRAGLHLSSRAASFYLSTHVFQYLIRVLQDAEAYGTLEVVGNLVYEHMLWFIVCFSCSCGWWAASGRSRSNGRTAHSAASDEARLPSLASLEYEKQALASFSLIFKTQNRPHPQYNDVIQEGRG